MADRPRSPAPDPRVPGFQLPVRWSADTCGVSPSPDHLAMPPAADGVKPGFRDGGAVGTGTIWKGCIVAGGGAWPSLRCWTNCSTGMDSDGGFTGTGPVLSIPGWRISISLFFVRNGYGMLSEGKSCPAGIGRTTSGGMMTNSSELLRDIARLVKSLR